MRFKRRGIRHAITAIAIGAMAIVLLVASIVLVTAQRQVLTDGIDTSLDQRATDMVSLAGSGELPEHLGPTAVDGFAQLVSLDGRVLASSANLIESAPMTGQLGTSEGIRTVEGLDVDDDRFRVIVRRIDGLGVLYVGSTFDVVGEATVALVSILGAVVPLVLVVFGALVWWLVGRTLGPVEAIRSQVANIDTHGPENRIPATGAGDEIDRLAGTMNAMLDRLDQSAVRQRRFVDDASHELRTPLARLRTTLEVDLVGGANGRSAVESMLADVREMSNLVDDLLFLARSDQRGSQPRLRACDLDDLVMAEADRLRTLETVTIDVSGIRPVSVRGDTSQLSRLVRNLLENAVRHARSRVTIDLEENDGRARLAVTDDGPGIAADAAEQVFERFGRLDDARSTSSGGTGLGLAIAREIARGHGGALTLANAGESGAEFVAELPIGL